MAGIQKPFTPLTAEAADRLPGHMGVYELGDGDGRVLRIGYAGGRSRYGLRGEVQQAMASSAATGFRIEVTTAYLTRYQELMMRHIALCGARPAENEDEPSLRFGRLSPGG